MSTRLFCAGGAGLLTCRQALAHDSDRLHASFGKPFFCGRPMVFVSRCSQNSVLVITGSGETPLRLEDLQIGALYKGKVSVVESYGVFVDIGAHVDGFVHNSRLGRSLHLKKEVEVGEDAIVQIMDVDPCAHSLSLLWVPGKEQVETLKLQPFNVSEKEICSRAAARRAKKNAAQCLDTAITQRVGSLESRQRLKAHRRAVLAEQQAIQLYLARSRISSCQSPEDAHPVDNPG